MGERGPVPKREAQRRRANDKGKATAAGTSKALPPAVDETWHPVARRWYESLAESGQSVFYAASDWATAYLLAEAISRELNPQPMAVGSGKDATVEMVSLPPKGASLAAWLKAMTSLLVTEGDRRRMRLELTQAGGDEGAVGVSDLTDYRSRLRSG